MGKCASCGKTGLFLKTEDGFCQACQVSKLREKIRQCDHERDKLSTELFYLKGSITPEMQNALDLQFLISKRKDELHQMDDALALAQSKGEDAISSLKAIQKEILVAADTVEMESFSLYQPKFDFVSSDEYKTRLGNIREKQKAMIKDATGRTIH